MELLPLLSLWFCSAWGYAPLHEVSNLDTEFLDFTFKQFIIGHELRITEPFNFITAGSWRYVQRCSIHPGLDGKDQP